MTGVGTSMEASLFSTVWTPGSRERLEQGALEGSQLALVGKVAASSAQ